MTNEQKKPVLAACPYCGGEAKLETSPGGFHAAVKCQECEQYGKGFNTDTSDFTHDAQKEAIAAWNRRYVCPDKHGKPMYAGDEACIMVKGYLGHAFGVVVWDGKLLRWGIEDERGEVTGLSEIDEIELIESDSEE